jgi:outer membrane protein assembly factor BamB
MSIIVAFMAFGCMNYNGGNVGWSSPVIKDGNLYFATKSGDVRAVVIETGQTLWTRALKGTGKSRDKTTAFYGDPVVFNDNIIIAGYNGLIYSIDINGDDNWVRKVGSNNVDSSPNIVGGVIIAEDKFLVGASDGYIYAFSIEEGILDWRFKTGNKIWSTPSYFEGVVYLTSFDNYIYAIDLIEGTLIWKFESDGAIVSSPVIIGDNLFFGSFGTTFYALDRKTGNEKWRFNDSSGWFWANPVVSNDIVLAPSLDGVLYALDQGSGQVTWTLPVESPIVSRPVIIGERFALATLDGRIIVSDLKTGIEVGSCNLEKEIRSPLVSFDEYLIVSPEDGSLRLISISRGGDLDEVWIYPLEEDFLSPSNKLWERAC